MSRVKYNREAIKQSATENSIRAKIVSGVWAPGKRLPTHDELLGHFGISKTTIQRVINRLVAERFLETRGSGGTFVSPRPPHLTDYGLIYFGNPEIPSSWGRFWETLSSSAKAIDRTGEKTLPQYYGVSGHSDAEDYQNLLRTMQSQRLAGLIFASDPSPLTGDRIVEQPGIPRVTIATARPESRIPAVSSDVVAFCNRAVDYLADRGRKRIAALFYAGVISECHDLEDYFLSALQRRGLTQKPYWRQYVNVFHPTAVCRAVHVLLHADQSNPPDALIVTDDTMLDAAINGLFAAGVNVPQDVEVVALANFPAATPTAMPIKRLGFDSRQILNTCIALIDAQRRGETVPSQTSVPALFDDEIR